MNVVREDVDALNAILKVTVTPEDYAGKVKETLDKYRKTAKIPGFRPGHVPFGLVQKQYGKGVLSEELNKLVNESLQSFISENKIDILGNPIPQVEGNFEGDFDNPADFKFTYDIGLAPEIKVALTGKNKFDYVKVKVDKKLIDKQIEDLQRRYGKLSSADEVSERDMIMAQFVELNDDESIKEGGILHTSTISMEFVSDKKVAKQLKGMKVGEKTILDPSTVSKGGADTAAMLGITEADLETISNKLYRANIVDRNGNYLVKTVSSIDIGISTKQVIDKEKLILNLKYIWVRLFEQLQVKNLKSINNKHIKYA